MKRVIILLVFLILASCVPPPTTPRIQESVRTFPQVAALFSQPTRDTALNTTWLQRLASMYDIGVFWMDAKSWLVDGITPMAWIKQRDPDFKALAYVPAGYWWTDDESCAITPTRCEVRKLLDTNDWWLHNPAGGQVRGWDGQAIIDTPRAATGLNAYWREWYDADQWDGMAWDVTDGNMHYVGGTVDFDRNSKADNSEHGFQWLDDTWTTGLRSITSGIGAASIGNGAWMPRTRDELSQVAPPLRGSIVELPSRWRNPETGRWEPSDSADVLNWHITNLLALKQRDPDSTYLVLSKPDLFGSTYWQKYLPDTIDQQRLAFGVALLTNNAVLQVAYGNVPWCDECGVSGGSTAWTSNWLGRALEPAQRNGAIWWRQFEFGAVYLNAGEQTYTMQNPPVDMRQIRGWYDREHNNGGAWDGRLEPYETRVLWRSGATTVATKTPVSSPTAAPTVVPTPSIADILQRIEALEAQFKALKDALQ